MTDDSGACNTGETNTQSNRTSGCDAKRSHLELELLYSAPEGGAFLLLCGELFFQLLAPDLRVALGLDGPFRLLVPARCVVNNNVKSAHRVCERRMRR